MPTAYGAKMKKIGEILIETGKVSERDIDRALLAQHEMGELLGQVLVKLGLVSELDMTQALSSQLGIPLLLAADYPEEPVEANEVALDFLLSNIVVPVSHTEETMVFAATQPQDPYIRKALGMALTKQVNVGVWFRGLIFKRALKARTVTGDDEDDELSDGFSGQSDDEFIEHLKDLASEAPVIRLVNQIIHGAVDASSSDIHIEPFDDGLHLRYRVDGVLQDQPNAPAGNLAPAIASRIKLLRV